jgi:hypothetical protein
VPGREGVSWLIADVNMHGVVLRRGEEARRPRRGVLPVVGGVVRDTDQDPQEVRRVPAGSGRAAPRRGGDLVEPRQRPRGPAGSRSSSA